MSTVAIVDYDCLCSAGTSLEASWDSMSRNRSGISLISRFNPAAQTLLGLPEACLAGEIPISFEQLAECTENLRKWIEPSYHAVATLCRKILRRLAFDVSRHDSQRVAVLGGTALTSQFSRDLLTRTQKPDSKFILNQCQNIPLSLAASEFGLQGPCFNIGSACSSSGHATLLASQLIAARIVDVALIVGYEFPIMPFAIAGLDWVSAVYRRDQEDDRGYRDPGAASRPFSHDRRGFIPAEGAGALFLSDSDYAEKHGWPIRGYVMGGYSNSDGGHLTRPSEKNIMRCMQRALEEASCNGSDIDCINAHATSTPIGDGTELAALHGVFGDHLTRIPVVANKSQIGHTLGASSILAIIFALHSMREGIVLPTLNHESDPHLPKAFIPTSAIELKHRVTMQNSFGFGGTNVSLVIGGAP